jgi:spermidine/putrescine transport system ATP-binding protein
MAEEILRVEGLSKSFDGVKALQHLDLPVEEGTFVTLLGPSGCGKSTTLRLLGGFETPDAGRIVLGGEDVTRQPPERRDVNMVFQDYALFPHMTAAQNVGFGLELKGWGRAAIRQRTDELFALLRIEGLGDRAPDQLSGGQRQRVALARALAPDPKLLLLDEPLAALDAKLRAEVQMELKSIQKRTGKTFVFVTHDQEEALTMSDRVIVMNNGCVEQDGRPEDLYHRPTTRFVAEFIGETNLMDVEVLETSTDRAVVNWCGIRLNTRGKPETPATAGRALAVLRPECMRLSAAPLGLDNELPGRVVSRVFRGPRVRLAVQPDGVPDALTVSLDPASAEAVPDGPVTIAFSADRVTLVGQ